MTPNDEEEINEGLSLFLFFGPSDAFKALSLSFVLCYVDSLSANEQSAVRFPFIGQIHRKSIENVQELEDAFSHSFFLSSD